MTTSKKWLKDNNFNYIHNRQTTNYYRFRIKEQIKGWNFSSKIIKIIGSPFDFSTKYCTHTQPSGKGEEYSVHKSQ